MDKFDRINNMQDRQLYEAPSSQENIDRVRIHPPLPKIVSVILIIVLILTVIYASLHPIDKILVKFFLFRSCTIEIDTIIPITNYETKKCLSTAI